MTKKYQQKTKPSYLLTTAGRCLLGQPDGSCNMGSPGAIGKNIAAILKPMNASSYALENPSTFHSDVTWPFPKTEPSQDVSGTPTEIATKKAIYMDLLNRLSSSVSKMSSAPTKLPKQDI